MIFFLTRQTVSENKNYFSYKYSYSYANLLNRYVLFCTRTRD